MFKPFFGICINCKRRRLVVVKSNLCSYCNYKRKQERKKNKIKIAKESQIPRGNIGYGSAVSVKSRINMKFYLLAWKYFRLQGVNSCANCGEPVSIQFSPANIAHILARQAYNVKIIKYNLLNVIFLCIECHRSLDQGGDVRLMNIWPFIMKRRELLKNFYHNFGKK